MARVCQIVKRSGERCSLPSYVRLCQLDVCGTHARPILNERRRSETRVGAVAMLVRAARRHHELCRMPGCALCDGIEAYERVVAVEGQAGMPARASRRAA